VERILNKQRVRGKDKYLVHWKGFMAESDTWEERENLENAKEAIEEFEREYWQDMEDVAWQEHEKGTFQRGELLGRFMAKKLYGWSDKRYDQEYWERMEKNWRQWKGKKPMRRETMKMIVRLANSKAGIKPTAPLPAFDKENSIGFSLDFLHYLYTFLTLTLY